MRNLGENLIFIISQPRSGSTLLQHILGSHPEVHTAPEPWFMLHLIYGLRPSGLQAEYNASYAHLALKDFLKNLPGDEEVYLEAMRGMALHLYEKALHQAGKKYFLDKTPRYYFIITELYRLFPSAKFVFLLRNPLAVFSSILNVNLNGNWRGLFTIDRRHDILTAPRMILAGIGQLGEKAAVIHYERLVKAPKRLVKDLCHQVGLAFDPDMLNYGDKVRFKGTTFVDSKSIYKHRSPVPDYLEEWVNNLDTPQKISIAKHYFAALGEHTVSQLGYPFDDLMDKLNSLKCRKKQFTIPWRLVVTPPGKLPWWDRLHLTLLSSLQRQGIRGTLRRCAAFVTRGY